MLNLMNLDDRTRQFMLEEVQQDANDGPLYLSDRLSSRGRQEWRLLLEEAVRSQNDVWLAAQLQAGGRLNATETRRKPKGGVTVARVPVTAPETLAEGEFNRFYIRGLCRRAIVDGIPALIVYRAKQVSRPRPESERRIGQNVDPQALLNDLRTNRDVDTALGVPAGPNSGLSVRLP
jgi:hypothetical protein